jgi:DNA-directed RNA polymerase subunit L
MFRNYKPEGPSLLTDATDKIRARFTLEGSTTTIANTLRRCVMAHTRSVSFKADLTNAANPGIVVRKNTSVIFNEMLVHRITLIPLAVRRIDEFDPKSIECTLTLRNTSASLMHVKASDFKIVQKGPEGEEEIPSSSLFPPDPITGDTCLITTLRPAVGAAVEEIDLTAYPVIGTGAEFMGFCPVSQCSYGNTQDPDPIRQEQFFNEWLADFKKIANPAEVPPDVIAKHKVEWSTMAYQRCFKISETTGEPNSFDFVVESVGVRPVKDIIAEGIQAVLNIVTPYANTETPSAELGITTQPVDSRMANGLDVNIAGHDHTLGNLLQTMITEIYLNNEAPDAPITFVGYKVPHPLYKTVRIRVGIRDGVAGDPATIARQVIAMGAQRAVQIFQDLAREWAAVSAPGSLAVGPEAAVPLEG